MVVSLAGGGWTGTCPGSPERDLDRVAMNAQGILFRRRGGEDGLARWRRAAIGAAAPDPFSSNPGGSKARLRVEVPCGV